MKKFISIFILITILFFTLIASEKENKSNIYFTKDISADGVLKVFEKIIDQVHGKVAIKVHFGEDGNKTFLKPYLVQKLVEKLNAVLVETNVLYVSKRRYTESHIQLAKDHGFNFAPIDILDSEGEKIIPLDLTHYKEVKVRSHIDNYDTFVIYSHFKGHSMSGFGGAIKNVSMGLASIPGKMALHASSIPIYRPGTCTQCGICVPECPGDAISINPLVIDVKKCIGCGTCIGICPVRCFSVPWRSTEQSVFLERLCEYTKGLTDNYNMVYINVLANISKDCDCDAYANSPFMDDIGILASTDIVAIEKASHDLIDNAHNCDDTFLKVNYVSGKYQIEYAYKLGMGNKEYNLIDIDK